MSLTVPSQSQVFEGTAGMTEAGWSVTRQPHGIVATRDGIGLDQGTAVASFSINPSVIHMSDWQVTADLRSEFAAAFVSAALFVVVVGWGALWWILRFQFPAIRVSPQEAASDEAEDLPPATAMALVRPGSEAGRGAELGTLFALAREGRIAASEGRLVATPTAQPPAWAHERLVLDLVARRASEPEGGRGLSSDLASARRAFRRAVAEDLTAHALLEPERVTVASGLRTTGWLGLVFGALCAVVAWLTLGRFGFWPQLFSGSLLLVAVAFLIATRWFRPMSRPGEAAAAYWRPRLKAYRARKGEDARDLPFALAAGLGAARRRPEIPSSTTGPATCCGRSSCRDDAPGHGRGVTGRLRRHPGRQ